MFITFELDRDELARKKISMNIAICKNREDFSGFSYCEKYLSFSEFTSINNKELFVLNGLLVFFNDSPTFECYKSSYKRERSRLCLQKCSNFIFVYK